MNLQADPAKPDVIVDYAWNLERANLCEAPDCELEQSANSTYCKKHSNGPRFICETQDCPKESGFFLRKFSSVSHNVDAFGKVDDENDNSYEGEQTSAVRCIDCGNPPKDLRPDDELDW